MDSFTLDKNELEKINRLTRRRFEPEELYAFPIVLCDNETDRDGERFSVNALKTLAKLFIGKTGIFDHDPKGRNQTARIYDTKVVTDSALKTSFGEPYTSLVGYAYMVRTEKNTDLIKEIDAGIKKEVSVSCAVKKKICSICGRDKQSKGCSHRPGKVYSSKLCTLILDDVYDAYEFSFVAIPAQPKAGVKKTFNCPPVAKQNYPDSDETLNILTKRLKRQASAAIMMEMPLVPGSVVKKFIDRLSCDELDELICEITKNHRRVSYLEEISDKEKSCGKTQNFKM